MCELDENVLGVVDLTLGFTRASVRLFLLYVTRRRFFALWQLVNG